MRERPNAVHHYGPPGASAVGGESEKSTARWVEHGAWNVTKCSLSLRNGFALFALANLFIITGVALLTSWTKDVEIRSWPAVTAGQVVPHSWSDAAHGTTPETRWRCSWQPGVPGGEGHGTISCRVVTGLLDPRIDSDELLAPWPGGVETFGVTVDWLAIDDPETPTDPATIWAAVVLALAVAAALATRLDWVDEWRRWRLARSWMPVAAGVAVGLFLTAAGHAVGLDPIDQRRLWAQGLSVWILVVVALPIAEEMNFRGVLYQTLANRAPLWQQALLNALLFAGAHTLVLWQLGGGWTGVMAMAGWLLAGFYFFWVRHHSGSVLIAAIAHGILNGLSLAYLALVQGSSG